MGLAASQARYLALTARKSDLEFQSQTINTRRIQLAYKTAEIARAYSEGMSNQRIKFATSQDAKGNNVYSELTFQNLLSGGYMVIGVNGGGLNPAPYTSDDGTTDEAGTTNTIRYIPKDGVDLVITADKFASEFAKNSAFAKVYVQNENAPRTCDEYKADTTNNKANYEAVKSSITKAEYDKLATDKREGTDEINGIKFNWIYEQDPDNDEVYNKRITSYEVKEKDEDNKDVYVTKTYSELTDDQKKTVDSRVTGMDSDKKGGYLVAQWNLATSYKINPNLTSEDYASLPTSLRDQYFSAVPVIDHQYKVNPSYKDSHGTDLQAMLVSGKAQIVTKEFYNFLVSKYGYSFADGMSLENYQKALDDWNKEQNNPSKVKSVIDWSSDETNMFRQDNYTEDDAAVLAKYEADTAEVNAQDKRLEIEEKNIETQHKAIEVELESIQKVIQNNIDKTFKIFT